MLYLTFVNEHMKEQLFLLVRTKHGISKGHMWIETKALYTVKSFIWLLNPFFPLSTLIHTEITTKQEKKNSWIETTFIYFPYQNKLKNENITLLFVQNVPKEWKWIH